MVTTPDDRPRWSIAMPAGGWGPPWPQAVELVELIPGDRWTLIGGLMVQLHVAHAGLAIQRATTDVDMVLHIETGAITFPDARSALEGLGYEIHLPGRRRNPVHRFVRWDDRVDVMVADHLAPVHVPEVASSGWAQAISSPRRYLSTAEDGKLHDRKPGGEQRHVQHS